MKKLYIIALFLIPILILLFHSSNSLRIVLHVQDKNTLPRNFRSTLGASAELAQLNISGSGQFSLKSLQKMREIIPNDSIIIVDMRQESHGFANGNAISWYANKGWGNIGKTQDEVEKDEEQRLSRLKQSGFIIAYANKINPIALSVNEVYTEKELVESLGLGYNRLAVTDHCRPSDRDVDAFIAFVKTLPPKSWLHFHCAAGRGRTTTFMIMYDMIHNSTKVDFEEILKRQERIGGMDLLTHPNPTLWKYPYALARAAFIKHFYTYSKENPNFEISWSAWLAQNPLLSYP